MRSFIVLFTFCLTAFAGYSQNFTWMRGSTSNSAVAGAYGTMGVASPANDPGTRHGGARWTDGAGNLWLYGGEGNDANGNFGWLSDLWMYNVSSNQWTWINGSNIKNQISVYGAQGVASSTINPGAREFAICWLDASGNFWLMGGDGYAANTTFGRLGDLWKYNPATNQWAWMNGFTVVAQGGVYGTIGTQASSNIPGCRYAAATWADASGNLWVFGGEGFDSNASLGLLNDTWRYNISSNQWTWMNGPTTSYQTGSYGTLLTPAASNCPPSRQFPAFWISSSGIMYLFGGGAYSAGATYLSDLWKYDPSSNIWTWINGSSTTNQTGVYGTLGAESSLTQPGGRFSPASWKDDMGNFWVFGGNGYSSTGITALNDLFRYNYTTNKWTWMRGSSSGNQNGTYGTQGVAAAANVPGGREYNIWWKGQNNTLWLFGGIGEGITGTGTSLNSMNDLWRFGAPCFQDSITSTHTICSGSTVTLSLPVLSEGQVMWYNSPTGTSTLGSGNNFTTTLSAASSQSVYSFYAQVASCTISPRGVTSISVNALPALTVTPTSFCNGVANTLTVSGANTYTWSALTNGSTLPVSPILPSYNFTVVGTDTNGCVNKIINSIPVNPVPSMTLSTSNPAVLCLNDTATLSAAGANAYAWSNGASGSVIVVTPVQNTSYTVTGTNSFGCTNTAVIFQTVNALPNLTVALHPICYGTTSTITASGAASYTWSNGHSGTTTTVSPGLPLTDYTVTGTDSNGCQNSVVFTQTVAACTGIKSIGTDEKSAALYPNPNSGEFTLSLNEAAPAHLLIFTVLGQKVVEQDLEQGINTIRSGLSKGLYYYQVQAGNSNLSTGHLLVE